jgi:thiopeptide-type bacteriocin biosynthesis protein
MTHFNFFIVRTPINHLEALSYTNNVVFDTKSLKNEMKKLFFDDTFKEAIYIASNELFEESLKYFEIEDQKDFKIPFSLYKYFSRSCTRSTPFGLFSAIGLGEFTNESSSFEGLSTKKYRKYAKLDMYYCYQISKALSSNQLIRNKLKYYTNSTLYCVLDKYRYIECNLLNGKRSFTITSVERNSILDNILKIGKNGIRYEDIENNIISIGGDSEIAHKYFSLLIDSQLIVSELEPNVTGVEYLDNLTKKLEHIGLTSEITNEITHLDSMFKGKVDVEQFEKIKVKVQNLLNKKERTPLVNIDCFLTHKVSINKKEIGKITKDLNQLLKLGKTNSKHTLDEFKKRFYEKYEFQKKPLLEALDYDLGIGFGNIDDSQGHNSLLTGFNWNFQQNKTDVNWTPFEELKLSKYIDAIKNDLNCIIITDAEIDLVGNPNWSSEMSESFCLFGKVIDNNTDRLTIEIDSIGGPSSLNMVSRFGIGCESIKNEMLKVAKSEEVDNENCIYAEIAHYPAEKVANILQRPNLRSYEIPFLCGSILEKKYQIGLDDLSIYLDNNMNVCLHSLKNQKRVIPRLTSAHNYNLGIGVYQFLCSLQTEKSLDFYWDWGILSNKQFLPRVVYKNYILSRAQWNIVKSSYSHILGKEITEEKTLLLLKEFNIPKKFVVIEGDNEFLIDIDTFIGKYFMMDYLKKKSLLVIKEYLFNSNDNNQICVPNEVIIPFKNDSPQLYQNVIQPPIIQNRKFLFGDNWLYIKIYIGENFTDDFLINKLKTFVETEKNANIIKQWFFLRFKDPENHIRIRFNLHKAHHSFYDEFKISLKDYIESNIIYKVQIDTYSQELERYGTVNINNCEEFFCCDSITVLNILSFLKKNVIDDKYRWMIGMRYIDMVIDEFSFSLPEKKRFSKMLSDSYFFEFNGQKSMKIQLDEKYRTENHNISFILSSDTDLIKSIDKILFLEKNNRLKIIKKVKDCLTEDSSINLESILSSFIHMTLIRLFKSKPRYNELIFYKFLYKFYSSQEAKGKSISSRVEPYL